MVWMLIRGCGLSNLSDARSRRQCGNKDIVGWKTGQGVFDWWMEDKNIDGQYSMDFDGIDLIGFNEKGN